MVSNFGERPKIYRQFRTHADQIFYYSSYATRTRNNFRVYMKAQEVQKGRTLFLQAF